MPILPRPIATERLILRPTRPTDAVRAVAIRSAWEVSRNLSQASFPPDSREIARWFADHGREWQSGEAYRFAIECDGAMIGVIDLDGLARGKAHLGYWLDRAAWGRGYASEAGSALVRFAFCEAGLTVLRAGHASDNPASGRVLTKLGFLRCGVAPVLSRPRGETIVQCHYVLRPGSSDVGAEGLGGQDRSRMQSFGRLLMSAPLTDEDLPARNGKWGMSSSDSGKAVSTGLTVAVLAALGPTVEPIRVEARAHGIDFVRRLFEEWESGANRFDRPGEIALGAWRDDRLVGLGGLNRDPYTAEDGVGRLRHVYVLASHRRLGIGALLVGCLLREAASRFRIVRLRAASPKAAAFYRRLGFVDCAEPSATHRIVVGHRSVSV